MSSADHVAKERGKKGQHQRHRKKKREDTCPSEPYYILTTSENEPSDDAIDRDNDYALLKDCPSPTKVGG